MRRLTLLFVFLPVLLSAQYWGERVTEQSFEHSSLHFNSYYLNPYGIYRFKDVTPGLIDDPFLNLHLNPANIPTDSLRKNFLYVDFRGDRTEEEITGYAVPMPYYDMRSFAPIPPDPRWYDQTRTEPEPLFSVGLIQYPFQSKLLIAASYQFIYKEEPYYQTPTWIYNSWYGYNPYGEKVADNVAVPIVDRYAGEDQMLTDAHQLAVYAALPLTETLDVGFGFNGVQRETDGQYGQLNADQYSTQNNDEWFNQYSTERNQKYTHFDLNVGGRYQIHDDLQLGLKLGYLQGDITQKLNKMDTSLYHYDYSSNISGEYDNWHHSYRYNTTAQKWDHDGESYYGTAQFNYQLSPTKRLGFYYNYTEKSIDLTNSSNIIDTSYYAGEWESENNYSYYNSWYMLKDQRSGSGKTDQTRRQFMLSLRTRESHRAVIYLGLHFSSEETKTNTIEPVNVLNRSDNSGSYWWENSAGTIDSSRYHYYYRNYEDKKLVWNYKSYRQSIQVPIVLEYQLAQNWQVMLGVNRIWNRWKIEDQTIAYFSRREKNENGDIKIEQNFGERYTEPTQTITDNSTDFMAGLKVDLSPTFSVNVLVDPQFEPEWRVAQWWVGFRLGL